MKSSYSLGKKKHSGFAAECLQMSWQVIIAFKIANDIFIAINRRVFTKSDTSFLNSGSSLSFLSN